MPRATASPTCATCIAIRLSGAYAWTIRDRRCSTPTRHAYGMAFVLLAYASALKAGIDEAAPWIEETWQLLEARFWDADSGLYRDEADADWHSPPTAARTRTCT